MHRALITLLLAIFASIGMSIEAGWDETLPKRSVVAPGYDDLDEVKSRMAQMPLTAVEGIWQLGSDQAVIAIERCSDPAIAHPGREIYQLTVIDSPRPSIHPGTVIGYAAPSGRRGVYDARIYSSKVRSWLHKPAKFKLTLETDDSHLALSPVKKQWKLLLRETLHFLVRIGLYADPSSQRDIDGLTRLYPQSTGRPARPVYL